MERATAQIRRYGVLALLVPSMLPPPAPFKMFVLLAGVVRIRPLSFAIAIGIGRGLRYFVEGLLAVWYGDAALRYVDDHGREVALGGVAAGPGGGRGRISGGSAASPGDWRKV